VRRAIRSRPGRGVATATVLLLVLVACDPGDDPEATGVAGVAVDVGVTDEPCPQAVDPDRGCIYLGVLSDLTDGPAAVHGLATTAGLRAFWDRVNRTGGIGGYEVDVDTYARDTASDPQEHRTAYGRIEPNVLALAQSFGTETTQALLPDLDEDDVLAVTPSGWSGWQDASSHDGTVLQVGPSDCALAAAGLDHLAATGETPASVLVIGEPGDVGGDAAAGARAWAAAHDAEWLGLVETAPSAVIGDQRAAVDHLLDVAPEVVVLAVGPTETAELVGATAGDDQRPTYLGLPGSFAPALLDTAAGDALVADYRHLDGWPGVLDGTSTAHEALRDALGEDLPGSDAAVAGWVASYPLAAALEAAVAAGDLTRAGLRAAADDLEVDTEGAAGTPTLGTAPDADEQPATVAAPDRDAPLGLEVLAEDVTLATTEVLDDLPCSP
jgi:ABC-type branched-subunit amino acid transport system substrate-binding protein